MINFFRKIRQHLLTEKRFSKYMLYAIGEIILVVIGILIALQVNNWNEEHYEAKRVASYYPKLIEEMDTQLQRTNRLITLNDSLKRMQKTCLGILSVQNVDKLDELKENLGAVVTIWTSNYTFVAFDEFVQQGLITKVVDPEIKNLLQRLKIKLADFEMMDKHLESQYATLIEPYFAKSVNYYTIAMPQYKKGLVPGGPEVEFETLANSMELWNITTLKLEITNSLLGRLNSMQSLLIDVNIALKEALDYD